MRAHISNSAYNVLDYTAQPAAMLIAAPILLRHLGLPAYGLWLIASAAISAGSIISSGFGDAVIQRIALLRARGDIVRIRGTIDTMLAINLALGTALAALLWFLIPLAVNHISRNSPILRQTCLWSLRIGAILIVIKSIESVFTSAQRAFEHYAPAVRIGILTRVLTVVLSIALVLTGFGVVHLMLGTAVLSTLGAVFQGYALRRHLRPVSFRPRFDPEAIRQLVSVGGFTWLQAVSGVFFSQADRLILGTMLGASAVAYYGISVQMAQPIHGITAAGLHFLFPHIASRSPNGPLSDLRRPIWASLSANLIVVSVLTAILVTCGPRVLSLWMGATFAEHTSTILPIIAFGFTLLALNCTAHYTLMALGHVRLVTAFNLGGCLLTLLAMILLVPGHGVRGAAFARICYGAFTVFLYLPLLRMLRPASTGQVQPNEGDVTTFREERV